MLSKIDILDSQTQPFAQPQSSPIKQFHHQLLDPVDVLNDCSCLWLGQNRREMAKVTHPLMLMATSEELSLQTQKRIVSTRFNCRGGDCSRLSSRGEPRDCRGLEIVGGRVILCCIAKNHPLWLSHTDL